MIISKEELDLSSLRGAQSATSQSSHMQRDSKLFHDFDSSNETKPIFFFYTWDHPAITIGKIQRNREALIKEAEALGVPCYLRPTGGRAVLHGGDICYTFIGSQSDSHFGGTMQESFKKVNQMVLRLFQSSMQIQQGDCFAPLAMTARPTIQDRDQSFNCFSSHVCNEGLFKDHKILGAAQAMGSRSFIQQGSIQINTSKCGLSYFKNNKSLSELANNGESYDLNVLCSTLNDSLI